jgi:triosephosphate isomerase
MNVILFISEVVLAPTALHLSYVQQAIQAPFQIAAQNCSLTGNGAFTGEISAEMLKDHNVSWVILGHSERRQLFKEDDAVRSFFENGQFMIFRMNCSEFCFRFPSAQTIGAKVKVALSKGLSVIACIGETLDERKSDQTMAVCIRQLQV